MPRSAARNAAESPPGPAPRTTTSQLKSAEPAYAAAGAGPAAFTAAGVGDFSAAGEGVEGEVAELSPSRSNITEPWETLSPTLTRSSFTTPEGDERGLLFHPVAGFDEDLDDVDVLEVADVRNLDFDYLPHPCLTGGSGGSRTRPRRDTS